MIFSSFIWRYVPLLHFLVRKGGLSALYKAPRAPVRPRMSIFQAIDHIDGMDFTATDSALPMLYAINMKKTYDCFIVYTDNETWFGDVKPSAALR